MFVAGRMVFPSRLLQCTATDPRPPIQYARTRDDLAIACSVMGNGPLLLLSAPPMGSHLEMDREMPVVRRYCQRLARSHTLVRFDHRGEVPARGFEEPARLYLLRWDLPGGNTGAQR